MDCLGAVVTGPDNESRVEDRFLLALAIVLFIAVVPFAMGLLEASEVVELTALDCILPMDEPGLTWGGGARVAVRGGPARIC
jgi:hypothetical protein